MPPDAPDAPTDAVSSRPVRADVTTTATAGGVLVAVTLRNDTAVDVRVRVDNHLDGPVLPPRREGVPAAGWDEDGFTGVVPANGRVGIGYACPSPNSGAAGGMPADPQSDSDPNPDPVSIDVLGPADEDEPSDPDRVAAAVRSLGRATPPADAVPTSSPVGSDESTADRQSGYRSETVPSEVPTPVTEWLDAVESRVERAERLAGATADEAAAELEECGGVDGVATLPDDLERDLTALRAIDDRIEALAARAAAADPDPVISSLAAAADEDTPPAGSGDGEAESRDANGPADPVSEVSR